MEQILWGRHWYFQISYHFTYRFLGCFYIVSCKWSPKSSLLPFVWKKNRYFKKAQVIISVVKIAKGTTRHILHFYIHCPSINIMQFLIGADIYWELFIFQAMFHVSWKEDLCRHTMYHVSVRHHGVEWIESGMDPALQEITGNQGE